MAARPARAAALVAALVATAALAQPAGPAVSYSGRMGDKALLTIAGEPRTLAVGASAAGVKLLGFDGDSVRIEAGGRVQVLALGAAPQAVGNPAPGGSGGAIVLTAGPGGHFFTTGAIDGRTVRFMVDTGASVVALDRQEAERLGLDVRGAPAGMAQTANGAVPVWRVVLGRVTVGDVTVTQVEAVVMPAAMGHVLLGNSFLSRFQMRRDNDVMRLELRR